MSPRWISSKEVDLEASGPTPGTPHAFTKHLVNLTLCLTSVDLPPPCLFPLFLFRTMSCDSPGQALGLSLSHTDKTRACPVPCLLSLLERTGNVPS